MFRFLTLISLSLLIAFTGIGLLICKQWGWSEYASPELYVLYTRIEGQGGDYFIANADGDGKEDRLTWNNERIAGVDCSPDGRTLAFLTDSGHLYVMNKTEIIYEKVVDGFYFINVANNGMVALSPTPFASVAILTNATSNQLLVTSSSDEDYQASVSSEGFELWSSIFPGDHNIQVLSPTGENIIVSPHAYEGEWLANERILTYFYQSGVSVGDGQYLFDTTTHAKVRVNDLTTSSPVSPDGTKVARPFIVNSARKNEQIIVSSLLSDSYWQQITYNLDYGVYPICFLTFRPKMLLADNS